MFDEGRKNTIRRAKAILDMGAMRIECAAGMYCVVMKPGHGLAVAAAGTAGILGMPFDLISIHKPFLPGEYRNSPHLLYAMSNERPTDEELRNLVLDTMNHAPLSLLILAIDGDADIEETARTMRSAHEECLISTCHY